MRACKSARVFYRPRVGRLPTLPALEIRGRAERQGSVWTHAPRRLATSRLVEAARNASPPNRWRPARDVYRFAPRRSRWETRSFAAPVTDATTLHRRTPATRPACPDRHALGLPGRQGVLACGLHAGLDAAWTAGRDKWRRISNAPYRPPRPASASGVLIKRPSVVEAGYLEYKSIVGLKSSGRQK